MPTRYLTDICRKVVKNQFFKDSAWSIFGNSIGYGLLLLVGMLIARFLGKDLYGEYGFVKTTMFQFAAFSTLGLGYTSTKFIAEYRTDFPEKITAVINASIRITTVVSSLIAFLLLLFAHPLAKFLEEPSLQMAFQALGIIIILRALYTTELGLISGFGNFHQIAIINVVLGISLLVLSIPGTYIYGLKGALWALLLAHIIVVVLCSHIIYKQKQQYAPFTKAYVSQTWALIKFSIPVALQELTYALGRWGGILIITKLSSLGEVGIFTASELWMAVILFIPTFLSNVMLSHLSHNNQNKYSHIQSLKMMIGVNLMCTIIPCAVFYMLSPWIVSLYGPTFAGMATVMRMLAFSTIFACCSNVLCAELIAQGNTWPLFGIRCIRDITTIIFGYILIYTHNGINAALDYAMATLACTIFFFVLLCVFFIIRIKPRYKIL